MLRDLGKGPISATIFIERLIRHGGDSSMVSGETQDDQTPSISAVYSSMEARGGLRAAHDASGSMGAPSSSTLVAFADADQTAVAHIDQDQELFSGLGGKQPPCGRIIFSVSM